MKDGNHYHNQGDPEGKHNHRKLAGLILLSVIFALIAYGLAQTAQTTADNNANITNVFEVVVNNTDKGCYGDEGGTCERVNGTTYNASNYSMNVYLKYHVVNNNAHTVFYVYINGTRVLWRDFTTIQADQNESFYFNVPKGANFSYFNNSVVHHVEWREYPILSGRNGTLSVNQTFITTGTSFNATYDAYGSSKVNKSGDTMSGDLNLGGNNLTLAPNFTIYSTRRPPQAQFQDKRGNNTNQLDCWFDTIPAYANGSNNPNGGRGYSCLIHVQNGSVPEDEFQLWSYWHPAFVVDAINKSANSNLASYVWRIEGQMAWQLASNLHGGEQRLDAYSWVYSNGTYSPQRTIWSLFGDGGMLLVSGSSFGYYMLNNTGSEVFIINPSGQITTPLTVSNSGVVSSPVLSLRTPGYNRNLNFGIVNNADMSIQVNNSANTVSAGLYLNPMLKGTNNNYVAIGKPSLPSGAQSPALIFDNISLEQNPTGMALNTSGLFAKNQGNTTFMHTVDSAGTVTKLGTGSYEFINSLNTNVDVPYTAFVDMPYIGKSAEYDISGALQSLEQLTGKKFIYTINTTKRDWDADEIERLKKEWIIEEFSKKKEIEVPMTQAFDIITESVINESDIIRNEIKYKYDYNGIVKPILKPVYNTSIRQRKVLKDNIRFDENTGRFYRLINESEIEASFDYNKISGKTKKKMPEFMAVRGAK